MFKRNKSLFIIIIYNFNDFNNNIKIISFTLSTTLMIWLYNNNILIVLDNGTTIDKYK